MKTLQRRTRFPYLTNTLRWIVATCVVSFFCTSVYAVEQWEWIAQVQRGNNITPAGETFTSQAAAAAVMRELRPPQSPLLTEPEPFGGSITNGIVNIKYTAPPAQAEYSIWYYQVTWDIAVLDPSTQSIKIVRDPDFALGEFDSEDQVLPAINAWHDGVVADDSICKGKDRAPYWAAGSEWVTTTHPGAPVGDRVQARRYHWTNWAASVGNDLCFIPSHSPIGTNTTYRHRVETCPPGYEDQLNGVCTVITYGTVSGSPHQCEATPISTAIGNPCDATTGSKSQTESDYSSDTLHITRSYNSHAQMSNSVGQGWSHNYDRRLLLAKRYPYFPTMLMRHTGVTNFLDDFSSPGGETVWQSTSGNGIVVKREIPNWRAHLKSGAQELYDTKGNLLELVSSAGLTTKLIRTIEGQIDEVTGPFGKTLQFNYDDSLRLTSIDDPAGNAIQYNYGPEGELIGVVYQDVTSREYHYEDPNLPFHLTGITDENGDRFATYGYDAVGRAILTTHADGFEQFTLAYEPTQTIVTDAAGTEQIYQFTTDTSKLRKLTGLIEEDVSTAIISPAFNVDRQRRPSQIVDANGVITEFEYDDFHLVRKLEAKGTPEERVTDFEYLSDDSSLVTGQSTQSVFTGEVRNVVTAYGSDSLPDSVTVSGFSPAGDSIQRSTTTTYNGSGKPLSIDGPRVDVADVTTIEYFECATGAECGQLKSMTNALGHVITHDNYDAHGRLTQKTDPNGRVTTNAYDLRGQLLSTTERSPEGVEQTMLFDYDDAGQLVNTTTSDGLVVSTTYNAAHLLTSVQDSHGNRIDYGYDSRGNQTDEDIFDPLGALRRAVDNSYDIRNQIASVNAGGFVSTVLMDALGNLKQQTDPALATTSHEYDGLNRPFRTTDAELGEILRSYDNYDNLIQVVAPNGATTTYEYDDLGNLLKETSPDRGQLVYSYDEAGNRQTVTDARGMTTTNVYDALNRVISRTYQDGQVVNFEYDQGLYGVGLLARMQGPSGQTEWDYDAFGKELARRQTTAGQTLTTIHGYDNAGRLTSMSLPSGKAVVYSYNLDQLVGMTIDGQSVLSGASYEPFGAANAWTWGDGTTHERTFDLRGLLTSHSIGADTRILEYDATGRVSGLTDSRQSLSYDYDSLGRLVSAVPGIGGSTSKPSFSSPPVLLASIQTMKNEIAAVPGEPSAPWLTVAAKNVTTTGAKISLERGQVNTGSIDVREKIGYLAIEVGSGGSFVDSSGNTVSYEAQITPEVVKGWQTGCFETSFLNIYNSRPMVMASLHSHNGGDGGWLRRCSLNKTALGLTVDEDRFGDHERKHNNAESAGMVAFSAAFDAQFTDSKGTWSMEAAKIALPNTAILPKFTRIAFRQPYATRPVVVVLPNKGGSNPASVRIRNVNKTGFEVVQVEPAPEDGTHGSMKIHYLAIERGVHTLPDGTKLEAGQKWTKKQKHGSGVAGNEGWATIKFSGGTPAMIMTQDFTYDANGNRTSLAEDGTTYPYSYEPASNRLLSATGPVAKTYSYDAAGNVLADGVHSYDYDSRNRLVSVDALAATYEYNGFGERVRKTATTDRIFVYDLNQRLIGEYDATGNPIQEFVNFGAIPVAVLDEAGQHLVHADHLGTPREITSDGKSVWRWQSTPFGETLPDDDTDGDATVFVHNMRYPGQYYDEETGSHYNYFRDYNPLIGRYVQSDPIGLDGGLNSYTYVDSDPLSFFDSDGQQRRPRTPGYAPIVLPRGAVAYLRAIQFGNLSDDLVQAKLIKIDRQIDKIRRELDTCQRAFFTLCWKREHTPGGLYTTDARLLNVRFSKSSVGPSSLFVSQGGQFWRCIVGQLVGSSGGCCEEQDKIPIE